MTDVYPYLRAAQLADSYFSEKLGVDSQGNFKVFKGDESPTAETVFETIDVQPVEQNPNNRWVTPDITFTFHGKDTDWPLLYRLASETLRLLRAGNSLVGYGQSFTASATTNELTSVAHQLEDGDSVVLSSTGTLPGGLSTGTYFVVEADDDTFQLSLTSGGGAIDLSSAGTGTHSFKRSPLLYELIGPSVTSEGRNPVTDQVTLSVAVQLGFDC